mgnify:CR=1 FL=1
MGDERKNIKVTRQDVILQIYRSLRDAFNRVNHVEQNKNVLVYYEKDKKITVSFRIKIEDHPTPRLKDYMP